MYDFHDLATFLWTSNTYYINYNLSRMSWRYGTRSL